MNSSRLFYGDVYECLYAGFLGHLSGPIETRRLIRKNALLLLVSNKCYVDLTDLNSIREVMKLKRAGFTLPTVPTKRGEYFVDEYSLEAYSNLGNVDIKLNNILKQKKRSR